MHIFKHCCAFYTNFSKKLVSQILWRASDVIFHHKRQQRNKAVQHRVFGAPFTPWQFLLSSRVHRESHVRSRKRPLTEQKKNVEWGLKQIMLPACDCQVSELGMLALAVADGPASHTKVCQNNYVVLFHWIWERQLNTKSETWRQSSLCEAGASLIVVPLETWLPWQLNGFWSICRIIVRHLLTFHDGFSQSKKI